MSVFYLEITVLAKYFIIIAISPISGQCVDTGDSDIDPKPVMNVSNSVLQKDSTKDLNKKNYQLSQNIRQLQREVDKMEETKERQSGNKAALSIIDTKLQNKKKEIQKLQEAEQKVQGEQQKRKDTKKLCVF